MAGLVPPIHVLLYTRLKGKTWMPGGAPALSFPGHDGNRMPKAKTSKPLASVDTLTAARAKVEHKRLALEIEGHDRLYYQDDAPKISDAEYDALRQRVNAIESRFPDLVPSESPSQKIGAAPSGRFAKVRHALPM